MMLFITKSYPERIALSVAETSRRINSYFVFLISFLKGILWIILFLGSWFFNLSCTLPSRPEALPIKNLRFSPAAYDPFVEESDIKYTLNSPAVLEIYIIKKEDGKDLLVKTLATKINETQGTHSHTWLGGNNEGYFVPTGIYYGIIIIDNERFETTVEIFHY